MPNWVTTKVKITGPYEDLVRLRDHLEGEDEDGGYSEFCFNKIIPEEYSDGDDWYSWRVEHWGTKWGACYAEGAIEIDSDSGKHTLEYDFQTAWGFCGPIMKKLVEEYPMLKFSGEFADEDYGYNCGKFKGAKGKFECNYLEGGTKKAYTLAFKLWGTNLAEVACAMEMSQRAAAARLWGND